ncbi:LacI family DNA-binding transcriptional regulator [Streptomyces sp. NPDC051773]|uniref:LacI family DNA-binding transcriptional regulator n=1 Tax=Streptomyces TaxID=1883 RepID=UPI0029C0F4F7|nr:LacI family DNA-binding transcriptional regulator [Streptomyces caniscabiei]
MPPGDGGLGGRPHGPDRDHAAGRAGRSAGRPGSTGRCGRPRRYGKRKGPGLPWRTRQYSTDGRAGRGDAAGGGTVDADTGPERSERDVKRPKPPSGKRPTILDVAAHAGVSHQTVSRFLRGNGGMKPQTVARIEQAVAELDYRPNLVARSMRTRKSNRVTVVLPAMTTFVPSQILRGASAEAQAAGYLLDIVGLEGDERVRGDRVRALLDSGQAEGVLTFTPIGDLEKLGLDHTPTVVIGEYDDQMRSHGITADGEPAAMIIDHLVSLGHRRFVHVAGSTDWMSARKRREVYLRTVAERGLENYAVIDGDWSVRSGYDAAQGLSADSGVTAVLAANDDVAMGVIRGFQDRGWRVPEDVSVFGWDNQEFTAYFNPSISTVDLDREAMGRRAMRALLARIREESEPELHLDLDCRLVLRESSGPARTNHTM